VRHRFVNALVASFSTNAILLAGSLALLFSRSEDGPNPLPLGTTSYVSTIAAIVWAFLLSFLIWTAHLVSSKSPRPGFPYVLVVLVGILVLLVSMAGDWRGPWSTNPYSIWNSARWELGWLFLSTTVAAAFFWRLESPMTVTRRVL